MSRRIAVANIMWGNLALLRSPLSIDQGPVSTVVLAQWPGVIASAGKSGLWDG